MALFQEDYRIRYGSYATDLTDQQQIAEVLGWQLAKDDGSTYAIDLSPGDHHVVRAVSHECSNLFNYARSTALFGLNRQ